MLSKIYACNAQSSSFFMFQISTLELDYTNVICGNFGSVQVVVQDETR